MREKHSFYLSADLGQVNDYTAISIIELIEPPSEHHAYADKSQNQYHLRHIERLERGTTYPKAIERIQELYESKPLRQYAKTIVIDQTGVGRAVWDQMQQIGRNGFKGFQTMYGISITGGNEATCKGREYHVPKRDLVAALQVAFQNETLKIAKGLPEAHTLIAELTNFKVKINLNGHDQYEAWREGVHDDLVLSAAMGVWLAANKPNGWIFA